MGEWVEGKTLVRKGGREVGRFDDMGFQVLTSKYGTRNVSVLGITSVPEEQGARWIDGWA